tara:strand:- start:178 stop:759 length:582 start_codon:yes stop_codon:yes gene_type:complete
MKKLILILLFSTLNFSILNSENKINQLYEGNKDAKIQLIVFESLTCSHCADFHKNVYPELKKNFIDTGLIKIEFRNFPLDIASLNASKIAHCNNDGKTEILHYLFKNQNKWAKGKNIEEFNLNLKNIIYSGKFELDFQKCIDNKIIEDHILEDRIDAMKKFKINATPTLIINNKKFDKPLNFKNLKKTIEKLI